MGFCTLLGAPKFISWNGDSRPRYVIIISAACKLEDLTRSTHIYIWIIWSIWLAYVSFMPLRFGSNGSTVGFENQSGSADSAGR
jgi:hypothetical protein